MCFNLKIQDIYKSIFSFCIHISNLGNAFEIYIMNEHVIHVKTISIILKNKLNYSHRSGKVTIKNISLFNNYAKTQ